MTLDSQLFTAINDLAVSTPWLHAPLLAYANDGIVLLALLMLTGWWVARRQADLNQMSRALWTPLGMLIALGLNQPIVDAVGEPRPYTTLTGILVLAAPTDDPSFPSDHAVIAGAVTAGLFLVSRTLGWLTAVAATAMAFARVYIGAHYPHDVAVGLLVGGALSLLGYLAARHVLSWLLAHAVHTPLRPLLISTRAATATQPRHR